MAFVASSMGLQMLSTAIGWEVFERTGDPLDLGYMGLARALPVIALTLPAGTVVDRCNRKVILSVTQIGFGLVAASLAFASEMHAPIWVFLLLLIASGCVRSFNAPSRGALLPSLLPPERFENAIAWQSGFFQFAAVAGPIVAGIVLQKTGHAGFVYGTTAALCISAGIAALFLRPRPVQRKGDPPRLRDMFQGAQHILREKTILGRSRSTCWRSCSAGPPHCSPCTRRTSSVADPSDSAPFVRRPSSAHSSWRSGSPRARTSGTRVERCS